MYILTSNMPEERVLPHAHVFSTHMYVLGVGKSYVFHCMRMYVYSHTLHTQTHTGVSRVSESIMPSIS